MVKCLANGEGTHLKANLYRGVLMLGSIIAVPYMETMKIVMTKSWVPMEREGVCSVKRDPIGFLAWANGCEGAFLSQRVGGGAMNS